MTRSRVTRHCRPGGSPGRRVLAAIAAAALVALAAPEVAAADDPVLQATLYSRGGPPTLYTVTPSDLGGCPTTSGQLTEYKTDGSTVTIAYGGGSTPAWTLGTVLTCGTHPVFIQPIGNSSFSTITVFGTNGNPEAGPESALIPGDLEQPSDFPDTSENPLIIENGSTDEYDRPWRGGADADFSDQVVSDDPIQIAIYTGATLSVSVSASPSPTSVDSPVSFSAQVSGASSSNLTYDWSFQDGAPSSSTSANPQVTFSSAGDWTVSLQVTDDQGEGGTGSTTVTVGSPPPTTTTGPTTGAFTTSTTTTSTTTTTHAGHRHPARTPTTTSGPARTTTTTSTTTTPTTTTTTTTTGTTTTTATTTAPMTTQTSSRSLTSSSSSTSTSTSTSTPATTSSPPPPTSTGGAGGAHSPPAPSHRPALRSSGSGLPRVTGRLIADITPVAADQSPLTQVSAAGAVAAASLPTAGAPSRTSPIAVVAGVAVALILLGLGAARELRGR